MAAKKEKLENEFFSKPISIGEKVLVKNGLFDQYCRDKELRVSGVVESINDDGTFDIKRTNCDKYQMKTIRINETDFSRDTFDVGVNPFPEKPWNKRIRSYNYPLESILHLVGASARIHGKRSRLSDPYVVNGIEAVECNFNPYVTINGEKWHYQRDYCWTLEDKQCFIESIYQGINCGQVLIRKRSFDYVDSELKKGNANVGFNDIVDGKQRLSCLIEFVNDGFTDSHGNYYSDFSSRALHHFMNSMCLSYAEMDEGTTDEEVIESFLHVNFTGVPMSKEHIEYVKEISKMFENGKV